MRPDYLAARCHHLEGGRAMADHEGELELELEQEFHEGELEGEGEAGLEGEGEGEGEFHELHEFHEGEGEAGLEGEGWLGAIGNVAGSLLGEQEFEGELETEQFFKGI